MCRFHLQDRRLRRGEDTECYQTEQTNPLAAIMSRLAVSAFVAVMTTLSLQFTRVRWSGVRLAASSIKRN
jgi:hypothetical protein